MKNVIHPIIRLWIRLTSWFFFEKIIVSGTENLPLDCPVILACNHPNAFLDALAMTSSVKRSLHYTARGDVFNSRFTSVLLHFINILPFYRKEEGRELMYKNNETFSYCIDVFKHNGAVIIFSEGGSENKYDLRPLRKGTARLAFEGWGNSAIGDKLKVVPVAIHYSSWLKTCPRAYIEFLENMEKKSFYDLNESGLFNRKFNERLKTILSEKCIVVDKSSDVATQNKVVGFILKNFKNGNILAKKIQDKYLSPGYDSFKSNYKNLSDNLANENIAYYKESETGMISCLFSSLNYAPAYILNALPYHLSKLMVRKISKDNDFRDSFHFCFLLIIYPAYLVALFCIVSRCYNYWTGVSIFLLTIISAKLYDISKRSIRCFLKKDKLKSVRRLFYLLFETSNG